MAISISQIIAKLKTEQRFSLELSLNQLAKNNKDLFSDISDNPWEIGENSIYLALDNEEFTDNFQQKTAADYIDLAIKNGAKAIATNKKTDFNIATIYCADLNLLSGFLAKAIYNDPLQGLMTIGVTGTKGKTTTSQMFDAILSQAKLNTAIVGTIGIFYPDGYEEPFFLSNPHAVETFKLANRLKKDHLQAWLMELTSHGSIFQRNSAIDFSAIVLTNVTSDHLDFHKTEAEYRQAKMLYFQRLAKQKLNSLAVINYDDSGCGKIIDYILSNPSEKVKLVTYSVYGADADYNARIIKTDGLLSEFEVEHKKQLLGKIQLSIPGVYNVYNALAAIATMMELNISWDTIATGISKLNKVPGRFERVNNSHGFNIIIDYAHTADSLENIIKNLILIKDKEAKLVTIFGCGGDRDKTKRPIMGEIAVKYSDYTIITSDNPRFEKPAAIIDDIVAGIDEKFKDKYEVEINREIAILKGLKKINKNDFLLIAGKGHEQFQSIDGVKHPFSDSAVVRSKIKELHD